MDSIPISHHHYPQSGYDKSMTNPSNLYSVWNNFFLSAGIPASVANEYAVTFSQHRIQIDMLKEITKDILLDMGIKAMGDIIAILRHAKQLCAQDELKGGGGVTKPGVNQILPQPTAHHNHNHRPQPQQPPPSSSSSTSQAVGTTATLNSLTQRTPISSARLSGPTISSSVGGKIQSRLSLSSGALRASLGPQIDSTTTTKNSVKPNSTMTIRQRGAAIITNSRPAVAEKTLTVRYSSAAAMEKMAHNMRMVESPKQHYRNLGSIKSRLDSGGNTSGTSIHRGKELQGTLRNGHYTGTRPTSHFTSNSYKQNNHRRDESTTKPSTSNSRLRSTVFNRLGEGPR